MTELPEAVVNIGPKLVAGLHGIGGNGLAPLRDEGPVALWERLRHVIEFGCTHSLLAPEGGVRGIRWPDLPADLRSDLVADVQGRA